MTDASKKGDVVPEATDFTILLAEAAQIAQDEVITVEYLAELDAINQIRMVIEQADEETRSYQTSS